MRKDSPRAHNCRVHEPGVSAAEHEQHTTADDTTEKTRSNRTRDDQTLPVSVQFSAETPTRCNTTQYDEILVAGDDAILFEASPGGRDG